ncbi:MAG: NYN domain-containing protein, partial [Hyphomicrobium sp.]
RSLVAALQQKGKRVSVVSTLQTQPPMIADELRRQADQFIEIADLENQIGRDGGGVRPVRDARSPTARLPLQSPRESAYVGEGGFAEDDH